jgi:threonine aldolase
MARDTTQTAPEPHEAQPREERDRMALFARCERARSGHGRLSMRDELAALAAEAGAEEERDVYGAGKLIADFEHEIAGMLGKPAAVFMPSGTMAQQIALRLWSERRGSATVAFHPT